MSKPTCFVIMPFRVRDDDLPKYENDRKHWDEVYSGLISPAIEAAEMVPMRDDEDVSSRLIVDGIWRKLEESDLVLCDLSSHNPNVYLELGWTLRADKKFILIKDGVTAYSFDLNQLHTFQYDQRLQPTVVRKQIVDLSNALKATIEDESSGYSLVRRMALSKKVEDFSSDNEKDVLLETILQRLDAIQDDRKPRGTAPSSRVQKKVRIIDIDHLYSTINVTDALDWPSEDVKKLAGEDGWGGWYPEPGMVGRIIHESWHPKEEELVYLVELDGHFAIFGKDGLEAL